MDNSYGDFAYSYDRLTENIDYEKRGAYFHQIMMNYGKTSGIFVDLACGTGSLSEFFARLNYEVIGVDASEAMLEIAQNKKIQSGLDIIYLHQNMVELDLFGTVDVVLCALDSLNHLASPAELSKVFERISLFLDHDALFIFDMNSVYKHQHVLANETYIYDLPEIYCVWQNRLREDAVVDITLDIFEYEERGDCYLRYQEAFSERAYPIDTLSGLLDDAGFEILGLYGDDSFDPPTETTQRIIGVCRNKVLRNRKPSV